MFVDVRLSCATCRLERHSFVLRALFASASAKYPVCPRTASPRFGNCLQ